jgi:DNA-binding NtrC family response regulator
VKPVVVDVRFIGSTNRQLEQLVQSGAFRADLFYRLNGAMIVIPPLRERVDEIPELVSRFVRQACERAGRPVLSVAPDAMASLVSYSWPGNIRELRNAVERAIALCTEQRAERHDFFPQDNAPLSAPPSNASVFSRRESELLGELDAIEKERVLAALESCHGNQTQAAKLLGISRRTLIARIESYGLPRPRKR